MKKHIVKIKKKLQENPELAIIAVAIFVGTIQTGQARHYRNRYNRLFEMQWDVPKDSQFLDELLDGSARAFCYLNKAAPNVVTFQTCKKN